MKMSTEYQLWDSTEETTYADAVGRAAGLATAAGAAILQRRGSGTDGHAENNGDDGLAEANDGHGDWFVLKRW